MKGGISLLLFDALIYHYLPPSLSIPAIVLASTIINTVTDLKWRYVDDQYVFQPVLFSLIYSLQTNTAQNFLLLNALLLVFSFALYAIGAWSSGDITAMLAAGQILVLRSDTLNALINLITVFALVYFASVLAYATVKSRGKIFTRPSFTSTLEGTAMALAVYSFTKSYALPIMLLISLASKKLGKNLMHAAGVLSLIYVLHTGTPPLKIASAFAVMYALNFVFSSTTGIQNYVFTRKVPAKSLKEGDVIKEMIVENGGQYFIVETGVKNIVKVKMDGAKIAVKPSSEGLRKEDIELIKEKFPNSTFTVHETVPVVPFILASIILLFLPVL